MRKTTNAQGTCPFMVPTSNMKCSKHTWSFPNVLDKCNRWPGHAIEVPTACHKHHTSERTEIFYWNFIKWDSKVSIVLLARSVQCMCHNDWISWPHWFVGNKIKKAHDPLHMHQVRSPEQITWTEHKMQINQVPALQISYSGTRLGENCDPLRAIFYEFRLQD